VLFAANVNGAAQAMMTHAARCAAIFRAYAEREFVVRAPSLDRLADSTPNR
jgi:hypothetical protein